jgi:hypothetical protein
LIATTLAAAAPAYISALERLGLNLVIAVTGLILGTWAGFRTTNLMISSVAISEAGEGSVPPFVLITDWTLMLPAYGLLLGISVVAVVLLTFSARRLDLHSIERVEAT